VFVCLCVSVFNASVCVSMCACVRGCVCVMRGVYYTVRALSLSLGCVCVRVYVSRVINLYLSSIDPI